MRISGAAGAGGCAARGDARRRGVRLRRIIVALLARVQRPCWPLPGGRCSASSRTWRRVRAERDYDSRPSGSAALAEIDAIYRGLRTLPNPRRAARLTNGSTGWSRRSTSTKSTQRSLACVRDCDVRTVERFVRAAAWPVARATPSSIALLPGQSAQLIEARLMPGAGVVANGLVIDNHDQSSNRVSFSPDRADAHQQPALLARGMLPAAHLRRGVG